MKNKKLSKLIQKPLRFHHQDIHEELDGIRDLLAQILINVQDIRASLQELRYETTVPLRPKTSRSTAENRDQAGQLPDTENPASS